MSQETLPPYGMLAEFKSAGGLVGAAEKARDAATKPMDAYSPFPIEGLMDALGHRAGALPYVVLAGGLLGGLIGYLLHATPASTPTRSQCRRQAAAQLADVHSSDV